MTSRFTTARAVLPVALLACLWLSSACSNDAAIPVEDLPLTVLPADKPSPRLALMLSGDGGWAGLDEGLGAEMVKRGVPVVGVSTLKYFWKERTPEETTADMARVLRKYLAQWKAKEVVLIGYSFGADVLPFVINRLPADLRARILTVNLLGLAQKAGWEVHVAGWVGDADENARPIAPELDKLGSLPLLCLYGEGDEESTESCKVFARPLMTVAKIGDGHHFGYLYGELADTIVAFAGR
ncbi:MAG: AcvB/VirJ family lysyl-phosphatidylglycerol hydrolase [Pseudomonadota bacterium]